MDDMDPDVGPTAEAFEQLNALQNRRNDQLEHLQQLTDQFRDWRVQFNGDMDTQCEAMKEMRTQLQEDSRTQKEDFQSMQVELRRQLDELTSANLSAFPSILPGDPYNPLVENLAGSGRPPEPPAEIPAATSASAIATQLSEELGAPSRDLAPHPSRWRGHSQVGTRFH